MVTQRNVARCGATAVRTRAAALGLTVVAIVASLLLPFSPAGAGGIDAQVYRSRAEVPSTIDAAGIAINDTGRGYWVAARNGRVYPFGDARSYGSAKNLRQPVEGMARTRSGEGYWLVASDGGVFSFGDARFYGSTGAMRLNRPIVGMAATPTGRGYWLVASDGGIFSFGDARFYGSTGAVRLDRPISDMARTPSGRGYWLVASDGGIFSFGDARFHGSAAGRCPGLPAVAIASSPGVRGYWLTLENGKTFAFSPTSSGGGSCGESPASMAARDLFIRVNDERAARGLAPLQWDGVLAQHATAWSTEMARSGFRHSDLHPLLALNPPRFARVAENIAYARGAGVTAGTLHVMWMRSDGHRANLLAPGLQAIGIGVYCAPDGTMWATQNFGRYVASGPGPAITNAPTAPLVRSDAGRASC